MTLTYVRKYVDDGEEQIFDSTRNERWAIESRPAPLPFPLHSSSNLLLLYFSVSFYGRRDFSLFLSSSLSFFSLLSTYLSRSLVRVVGRCAMRILILEDESGRESHAWIEGAGATYLSTTIDDVVFILSYYYTHVYYDPNFKYP